MTIITVLTYRGSYGEKFFAVADGKTVATKPSTDEKFHYSYARELYHNSQGPALLQHVDVDLQETTPIDQRQD